MLLVGLGTAIGVAAAVEMSLRDALELAGIASGSAAVAGAVGALVLWATRRRSLGVQLVLVALTSVGAVAGGAVVTAQAMFFSAHDLHSLFVVVIAAAAVGIAAALVLGLRVADAARALGAATGRIGEGEVAVDVVAAPSEEFATLGRKLSEMSTRLDEARGRERALDASRRELVAWVSHDLRTPLSGIRAMAEALEDGVVDDSETVARYHNAIRREADRLAGLVDDLFELSSINAGTLRLERERASLSDLVSDALAAAAGRAELRAVRLEGRLTSEAPEVVLSVPEFGRVLRNLLENAIRHTPADGTVTVEAGSDGRRAFVSVTDSCGGIPTGDIERVFDVAFRGEASRTPGGGAGLGLAIARGIVEAHEGEITVQNEGPGCRFTVRLPIGESESG